MAPSVFLFLLLLILDFSKIQGRSAAGIAMKAVQLSVQHHSNANKTVNGMRKDVKKLQKGLLWWFFDHERFCLVLEVDDKNLQIIQSNCSKSVRNADQLLIRSYEGSIETLKKQISEAQQEISQLTSEVIKWKKKLKCVWQFMIGRIQSIFSEYTRKAHETMEIMPGNEARFCFRSYCAHWN